MNTNLQVGQFDGGRTKRIGFKYDINNQNKEEARHKGAFLAKEKIETEDQGAGGDRGTQGSIRRKPFASSV